MDESHQTLKRLAVRGAAVAVTTGGRRLDPGVGADLESALLTGLEVPFDEGLPPDVTPLRKTSKQ